MANDYQWNKEQFASQTKQIRAHLLKGKHITQLDALNLYGCLRLSAVIFNLRKEGLPIIMQKIRTVTNKLVGDYYIKEEDLSPSGVQTRANI